MATPAKRRKVRRAKAQAPVRRKPRAKRPPPESAPAGAIPRWVTPMLETARARARRRADELRARYPEEDPRALGERLVRSQANRGGLAGGATATLALFTL